MTRWELLDIVEVVGGELVNPPNEDLFIEEFQQDSRKIERNSLFVPLIAERNGHDFIDKAKEAGAVASFWSESLKDAPKDIPLIRVKDSLKALQEMAAHYLNEVNPKVVAVTGSNGKTTTKDMVNKVLEASYQTHKTAGNYNNEIGLPLTILDMDSSTEILILEMGTSSPGEIEFLSKLTQPDLAIVTMIGESHIEAFGSREELAKEKVSIRSALKENGLFIYPENEPLIKENLLPSIRDKNFSITGKADLYAEDITEKIASTEFILIEKKTQKKIRMEIPIPGSYNVNNALIAVLVGIEFGVSLEEAKKQLARLKISKDRLEWVEGINQWSLLNDAYNASPSSVRAVLTYFEKLEVEKEKVLVLGDILELGEFSKVLHEGLADAIKLTS
ncbi:MAG: UDP-N-acetylmuramoyl-tripeptide--D-alanyl-D-alanine ligase, partial [Atopostipes sp.]|nr:UDP-N-acetylmuramoyl-tripeptide--D-alanyl-D-alanine ligase [Atopostipes sp.]